MFNIYLTGESVEELDPGVEAVYGRIHIGDYYETFAASLVYWKPGAYQVHWRKALQRIVEGATRSAVITSYVEPTPGGSLTWWPIYRERETIYFQNQLLFFDQVVPPFSPDRPWESVGVRETMNPEGRQISEWKTALSSVNEWLRSTG